MNRADSPDQLDARSSTVAELENCVVKTVETSGPIRGRDIVSQLEAQHARAEVREAVWRLLDRGTLRLRWNSTLDVAPEAASAAR